MSGVKSIKKEPNDPINSSDAIKAIHPSLLQYTMNNCKSETVTSPFQCEVVEMPNEEDPGFQQADALQQFCLRWNNYQTNLADCFHRLLLTESFADVTLACDGQSIKAHKVVLSACSPYFQTLFTDNPCQHPIIIMRDTKFCDLKAVIDFMYRGEINISQNQIGSILKVAEMLKIRGLTDINNTENNSASELPLKRPESSSSEKPATKKRRLPSSCERSLSRSPLNIPVLGSPEPSPLTTNPHEPISQLHVDLEPGIDELIEEETSKIDHRSWFEDRMMDVAGETPIVKAKTPSWSQEQLQEAIRAVVTQRLRFTQASAKYNIPKGTLYDNILGKSKRMLVLDEAGLQTNEEQLVIDYCCETALSPYNRRTRKSLTEILEYVEEVRRQRDPGFAFTGLAGFRWWWAFCKKHSIVSQYREGSPNR